MKKMIVGVIMAVVMAGAAMAEDHPEHKGATAEMEDKARSEFAYKLQISKAFVKAADKQFENSDKNNENNLEASALMKNARLMLKEGEWHFDSKQYTYAVEDLLEATQMATHAIILIENEHDAEIRDVIMHEERLIRERQETERKESIIKKSMEEAVVFIGTAERILQNMPNEDALKKLSEAQTSLDISKAAYADNDFDSCLEELNRSYKLATRAIKDAYKSKGVTFVFPGAPVKK